MNWNSCWTYHRRNLVKQTTPTSFGAGKLFWHLPIVSSYLYISCFNAVFSPDFNKHFSNYFMEFSWQPRPSAGHAVRLKNSNFQYRYMSFSKNVFFPIFKFEIIMFAKWQYSVCLVRNMSFFRFLSSRLWFLPNGDISCALSETCHFSNFQGRD